jgi:hypothetical protein
MSELWIILVTPDGQPYKGTFEDKISVPFDSDVSTLQRAIKREF